MSGELDGLLTFFASHHAIRAEKVLAAAGLDVELVPGPKELSPNCGVAVRFRYEDREAAARTLAEASVKLDEVHPYRPATDAFAGGSRRRRRSGRQK